MSDSSGDVELANVKRVSASPVDVGVEIDAKHEAAAETEQETKQGPPEDAAAPSKPRKSARIWTEKCVVAL